MRLPYANTGSAKGGKLKYTNFGRRNGRSSILECVVLVCLSSLCIAFILLMENILSIESSVHYFNTIIATATTGTGSGSGSGNHAKIHQLGKSKLDASLRAEGIEHVPVAAPIQSSTLSHTAASREGKVPASGNKIDSGSISSSSLSRKSASSLISSASITSQSLNQNFEDPPSIPLVTYPEFEEQLNAGLKVTLPSVLYRYPPPPKDKRYIAEHPPFEKRISLIPGTKTGIRQDRRAIVHQEHRHSLVRPEGKPSGVVGKPRALLSAEQVLQMHPLRRYKSSIPDKASLADAMVFLQMQRECANKPIFLTMATVGDELYWQLIENFVYSMVKFNTVHCSLIICVTDDRCMKMCDESYFPCYDYRYEGGQVPSVMEQIAIVKLVHVPKAMSRGVDVFMLDLDVGFLQDPMLMVEVFRETPLVDIFVQEDFLFIMNRTRAGWKTWFTEPLPNIGLFLCRGNNLTAEVFEIAWKKYSKMEDTAAKINPGKDQNHVLEGMRILRAKKGLRYAYFNNDTAVLLDKMNKFSSKAVELGGEMSMSLLEDAKAIAMHTTCYEQSTKVMGLKATNAFWNPKYYDPLRPTITKQLLYISDNQILDEVRSLVWLAKSTGRSVVLPNLLGSSEIVTVESYNKHNMWPGFRVSKFKKEKGSTVIQVDVLEPAYYWRIERDYDEVPEPSVVLFNPAKETIADVHKRIASMSASPRIVLHATQPVNSASERLDEDEERWQKYIRTHPSSPRGYRQRRRFLAEAMESDSEEAMVARVIKWAKHSVGWFEKSYEEELQRYGQLPTLKAVRNEALASDVLQGMRNCMKIFGPLQGNRTCFQICD